MTNEELNQQIAIELFDSNLDDFVNNPTYWPKIIDKLRENYTIQIFISTVKEEEGYEIEIFDPNYRWTGCSETNDDRLVYEVGKNLGEALCKAILKLKGLI